MLDFQRFPFVQARPHRPRLDRRAADGAYFTEQSRGYRDLIIERTQAGQARAEGKHKGRPAKTTELQRQTIRKALGEGATVTSMAAKFKVSRATFGTPSLRVSDVEDDRVKAAALLETWGISVGTISGPRPRRSAVPAIADSHGWVSDLTRNAPMSGRPYATPNEQCA